jgi:hypothetical protein
MLIGAEGVRLLENAIAFPSCVGGFKDVIQCPAGVRGRGGSHTATRAEINSQVYQTINKKRVPLKFILLGHPLSYKERSIL